MMVMVVVMVIAGHHIASRLSASAFLKFNSCSTLTFVDAFGLCSVVVQCAPSAD